MTSHLLHVHIPTHAVTVHHERCARVPDAEPAAPPIEALPHRGGWARFESRPEAEAARRRIWDAWRAAGHTLERPARCPDCPPDDER